MSPFPEKGAMNAEFIILFFFLPLILIMFITTPGTTIEYGPLVNIFALDLPFKFYTTNDKRILQ